MRKIPKRYRQPTKIRDTLIALGGEGRKAPGRLREGGIHFKILGDERAKINKENRKRETALREAGMIT